MCKGNLQDGSAALTAHLGNCIVIIKNVPARICGQCGEVSYNDDVARRLEQIANLIKRTVVAEIAVIDYTEKAA
jgi:YgiT-type zinc finger domain-containing protein